MDLIAALGQCRCDLFFKDAVHLAFSTLGKREPSGSCKMKEELECSYTFASCALQIDILIGYRRVDFTALLGATN
ncbi:hypothetical protein D3C80_1955310 [compost metagenome]